MKKKALSFIVALTLVLSLVAPSTAYAQPASPTYRLFEADEQFEFDFVNNDLEPLKGKFSSRIDGWDDDYYENFDATIPLLTVRINFADVKGAFSDKEVSERVYDNGISEYYTENSNGKFTYVKAAETGGTIGDSTKADNDGVVTANLPITFPRYDEPDFFKRGVYYGTDGMEYSIFNVELLFAYALNAVEDQVDFSAFDKDGNGRIDPKELGILVVYPGMDAAVAYYEDRVFNELPAVWPHSSTLAVCRNIGDGIKEAKVMLNLDGVGIYSYTCIAENIGSRETFDELKYGKDVQIYNYLDKTGTPVIFTIGVACHELAHDLGLYDLYNTVSGDSVVKDFSLMDAGSYGNKKGEVSGTTPTHIDPYSKVFLGFYESEKITESKDYVFHAASDSANYNIIKLYSEEANEYYLLEYRNLRGFDAGFYRSYSGRGEDFNGGLVVWKINQELVDQKWNLNQFNNDKDNLGIGVKYYFLQPGDKEYIFTVGNSQFKMIIKDQTETTLTANIQINPKDSGSGEDNSGNGDSESGKEPQSIDLILTDSGNILPAGSTLTGTVLSDEALLNAAKELVRAKFGESNNAVYYEFNLKDSGGNELHQLGGKIQVTVDAPFQVRTGYKTKVFRVDGDNLVECESRISGGRLIFETDHFSTYVFVEEPETVVANKVAPTGDNSFVWLYVIVMMAGGAGVYLGWKRVFR